MNKSLSIIVIIIMVQWYYCMIATLALGDTDMSWYFNIEMHILGTKRVIRDEWEGV